jgi:hypothetical protein
VKDTGGDEREGLRVVWAGAGMDAAVILDQLLSQAAFNESDVDISLGDEGLTLVAAMPEYEERRPLRQGRRWFRKVDEVPLYRCVIQVLNAGHVEICDESGTYEHRFFSVRYEDGNDRLVFDANPPFTIRVERAGNAAVEVLRSSRPVGVRTVQTLGPMEIE